jgi:hypothetical protein
VIRRASLSDSISLSCTVVHTPQVLRKTGALPKDSPLHVKGLAVPLSITDFAERAVKLLMCVVMVEEQADLTAFLVPLESEQDVVRSPCIAIQLLLVMLCVYLR